MASIDKPIILFIVFLVLVAVGVLGYFAITGFRNTINTAVEIIVIGGTNIANLAVTLVNDVINVGQQLLNILIPTILLIVDIVSDLATTIFNVISDIATNLIDLIVTFATNFVCLFNQALSTIILFVRQGINCLISTFTSFPQRVLPNGVPPPPCLLDPNNFSGPATCGLP